MRTLINPIKYLVALLCLSAVMLSGCTSTTALPEGASAPKLKVESLSLVNHQDEPYFVVTYSVEHKSLSDLPLKTVRASVFIRDNLVALVSENAQGTMVSNQGPQQFEVKVPVNVSGDATFDSLANSSLIMLQGSCALTLVFSDDPKNKGFNPSASYSGLVRVTK